MACWEPRSQRRPVAWDLPGDAGRSAVPADAQSAGSACRKLSRHAHSLRGSTCAWERGLHRCVPIPVVTGVCLQSGEELSADLVVVAMGSLPATDWLTGSGLQIADGVVCDSRLRAAPNIYAVGDVARFSHEKLRIALMAGKSHQCRRARALCSRKHLGNRHAPSAGSVLWTDQFDVKIQVHGFVSADAEAVVVGAIRKRSVCCAVRKPRKGHGALRLECGATDSPASNP